MGPGLRARLCLLLLLGLNRVVPAQGTPHTANFPRAGESWALSLGKGETLTMLWIPAGTFLLGSTEADPQARADEQPQTRVMLTHGYWIGATHVTIAQWRALTGRDVRAQLIRTLHDDTRYQLDGTQQTVRAYMHFSPDQDPGTYLTDESPDIPMYYISWLEVVAFCRQLNRRERAAGRLPPHYEYALPTEAQWEYASRAGDSSRATLQLTDIAWFDGNSAQGYLGKGWPVHGLIAGPHAVAQKQPNAWGLYDMAGNLWEWCRDWYGPYPGGSVIDPTGPAIGNARVNRGGSFGSGSADERPTSRAGNPPAESSAFRGFRLALVYQ